MQTVARKECQHPIACQHGNCRGCEPCGDCAMERVGDDVLLFSHAPDRRGTIARVRFDDLGKPIYHLMMKDGSEMLAREEEISSADRDDFFWDSRTADENNALTISKSDEYDGSCLIQIGVQGDFCVAYLTDEQVLAVSRALDRYLKAK